MLHNLCTSTSVWYVFFRIASLLELTVLHVLSRATMLLRTIIINELHNGQWYDSSTEALLHCNMQLCNCAHRCHYTQPGGHTVAYKRALTLFKLHSCLTQHVNVGKLCVCAVFCSINRVAHADLFS